MIYQEWKTPPELKFIIDCIWTYESKKGESQSLFIIPDGCIDLVIEGGRKIKTFWVGAMFERTLVHIEEDQILFGIRFKPGSAYAIFPFPMNELSGKTIPSEDLNFDDSFFLEHLFSLNCLSDQVNRIYDWVLHKTVNFKTNSIVRGFMTTIEKSFEPMKISQIAEVLGISRQYLGRVFCHYTGLDPKTFYRIYRIQKALNLISLEPKKDINWVEAAVSFGFYDQSHFIHEFNRLIGTCPLKYEPSLVSISTIHSFSN